MVKRLSDNKELVFDEKEHTYNLRGLSLVSVTEFVNYFFPLFDEEEVSKKVAAKKGITPEEVIKEWDDIRAEGTKVHQEVEEWIKLSKQPTTIKAKNAVNWLLGNTNYYSYDDKHSEVIIFSESLGLAGTIDLLLIKSHPYSKPSVVLIDWKTNNKMTFNNVFQNTKKEPVIHLHDSKFNHYQLQLSTYAYILERDYGFLIDDLMIVHLTEEKAVVHKVDYLKNTVKRMINYYWGYKDENQLS